MQLPKIGNTVTTQQALELCKYFGFDYLIKRIEANPDAFKDWEFDGCSGLPDDLVSELINVPDLTEVCLKHDLQWGYGEKDNEEEKLMADFQLGLNLLKAGASAGVAKTFFEFVNVSKWSLFSFKWGFAWKDD